MPKASPLKPVEHRELLALARQLSESFHRAKVPKEARAWWVALLCLAKSEGVELESTSGRMALLVDHGAAVFSEAGQGELWRNASHEPSARYHTYHSRVGRSRNPNKPE